MEEVSVDQRAPLWRQQQWHLRDESQNVCFRKLQVCLPEDYCGGEIQDVLKHQSARAQQGSFKGRLLCKECLIVQLPNFLYCSIVAGLKKAR